MVLAEHRSACSVGWIQRDTRPIWQVADNRYGLDRTRRPHETWQLSRTPWAKQILEDSNSPKVSVVVLMAGSQVAKTAPMLIRMAYGMVNNPVPRLWITGDDGLAVKAYDERIKPTLERCPDLKDILLTDRLHMTQDAIKTKLSTLDIAGSKASGALHQNPYAEVFADECGNPELWPQGQIQRISKRLRSFASEGGKAFLFSAPGFKGDEFHERYMAGTQNEWVWPCMKCGAENKLEWSGLKYGDESGGEIHIGCIGCGHRHADNPAVRRHICENGFWQAQNPTPEEGVVSYHWNALLPTWVSWKSLVDEWINANEQKKRGNIEPLKVFIRESLGEPWEDRVDPVDYSAMKQRGVGTGYLCPEVRSNVWLNKDAWPFSRRTLLMVDVQETVKYWNVVAWGLGGVSRLLGYGRSFTFEDIRAIQEDMQVKDADVGIDEGYSASEVRPACLKYHWKSMKGEDVEYYLQDDPTKPSEQLRTLYRFTTADPFMGKAEQGRHTVQLVQFSVPGINDMLELFLAGRGPDMQFPEDLTEEFYKQLIAVRPEFDEKKHKKVWKQKHRDDHWRDCYKEQFVGALALGLIGSEKR